MTMTTEEQQDQQLEAEARATLSAIAERRHQRELAKLPPPMTMRQVRDALVALPESPLLDKPAQWWGEEKGGTIKRVDVLSEDYLDMDGDIEPRSMVSARRRRRASRVWLPKGMAVLAAD